MASRRGSIHSFRDCPGGRLCRPPGSGPLCIPMTDPDYYAILAVATDATPAEITHAYRALLREHHPDTRRLADAASPADSDSTLQQVLAAYAVLADPQRRAEYDRRRAHDHRQLRADTAAFPPGPISKPIPVRVHYHPPSPVERDPAISAGPVRWQPSPRRAHR